MTFLITGGLGFVGPFVAAKFLTEGKDVVLVDRAERDIELPTSKASVRREIGDITDKEWILDLGKKYEIEGVAHLATLMDEPALRADPVGGFELHVNGTLHLLELSRKAKAPFVYLSTQGVYGPRKTLDAIEEADRPAWLPSWYGNQKIIGEITVNTYHHLYGVPTVIIRPNQVFGPNPRNLRTLLDLWLRDISQGKTIQHASGGDFKIGWTYVKDLANAIFLGATKADKINRRTFNIECGEAISLHEMAELIKKLLPAADFQIGPGIEVTTEAQMPPFRGVGSIQAAKEELGYEPTPFKEAVKDYVSWMKARPAGNAGNA